mmetsp:Transcript_5522/g.13828  ORF Transcript_5522/g.13828 Transcript_5522/m.13828 type:complete len:156 (-) Transcript_5522:1851-2318(-)
MVLLIHRTHYWGRDPIEATLSRQNQQVNVDFPLIWTQAVRDGDKSCCYGFGPRRLELENADVCREHLGTWHLYLVEEVQGNSEDHYFFNFVAFPKGSYGLGKAACSRKGWKFAGSFSATDTKSDFDHLLQGFMSNATEHNHTHVGFKMETFDPYI